MVLTSYDNATDTFGVLDPGFDEQRYARSAVHDYLMYEVLPHDAIVPHGYRLFKQCDPAWGSTAIVHKTICAVGCRRHMLAMLVTDDKSQSPMASLKSHAPEAVLLPSKSPDMSSTRDVSQPDTWPSVSFATVASAIHASTAALSSVRLDGENGATAVVVMRMIKRRSRTRKARWYRMARLRRSEDLKNAFPAL